MQDFALSSHPIEITDSTKKFTTESPGLYVRFGKRLTDLTLAALLLPIFAPIIGLLWCLVRVGGGPGFFGHTRIGQNGRAFTCWKIRTMAPDAENLLRSHLEANPQAALEWAHTQKLTHDPRISRLGRILRKTSLDELPQIWNVLKGEMSFVGPRPVVAEEVVKYGKDASSYLAQKPGLTGLWQVSGRNEICYSERVSLDVAYLARRGLACDLYLIAVTIRVMLLGTGR